MGKTKKYDVVVVGAGPAGYVCAIRCSQLGLKTACVDEWIGKDGKPTLGGTCLNVGCIPSKALLDSSEHYYRLSHDVGQHGIKVGQLELDLNALVSRKDKIVRTLTKGVESLFKKNKVDWIKGSGSLLAGGKVAVSSKHESHEELELAAEHIVLATGSSSRFLPNVPMDDTHIVDSTGAMEFSEVPETLGIIGAGVIGLEMGSVWNRLGSKVVLLEAMDDFLFFCDRQISTNAMKEYQKQGLDIRLSARVSSAEVVDGKVVVDYEDGTGRQTLKVDKLVVAVGRRPNTANLGLAQAEVLLDESGYIGVNKHCRTNVPNIHAIGDVVQGPMLAHKGSEEGIMVAERIAGQKTEVNHNTIPWVIYTWPEIAWVGKTEAQLKQRAVEYKTGTFPMRANGRALAMEEKSGLIKVIADAETDEVLGVHIFGPFASELIAEAVVAMEFKATAEDLARTVHAHPTISEALHEAALGIDERALHI